ncbi:unnamed protein product [Pleuronectes platessa]|uniref:Uncharacterized protein n=1 Tax=Pleuronectes platessa TaxID=8262 RepID=A0A9N7Y8Z7_PLEPL|nr:unnamed protein product [Pleuronectes platessa]
MEGGGGLTTASVQGARGVAGCFDEYEDDLATTLFVSTIHGPRTEPGGGLQTIRVDSFKPAPLTGMALAVGGLPNASLAMTHLSIRWKCHAASVCARRLRHVRPYHRVQHIEHSSAQYATAAQTTAIKSHAISPPVGCSGHPLASHVHYMILKVMCSGREAVRDSKTSVQQPTGICPVMPEAHYETWEDTITGCSLVEAVRNTRTNPCGLPHL